MNLATQYEEKSIAQRRQELVVAHLDFVRHILGRVAHNLPTSVDSENLEAAGILGLVEASQQYDADRGVPFKGFAYNRIRGAILDELRRNCPLPQQMLQQVATVRRVMETLAPPIALEDIAAATGFDLDTVSECMAAMRLTRPQVWDESLAASRPRGESAGEPSEALDHEERKEVLAECISQLPRQERIVVTLYYLEELRLKEIGKVLGLSESRISRVLSAAECRLKSLVRSKLN